MLLQNLIGVGARTDTPGYEGCLLRLMLAHTALERVSVQWYCVGVLQTNVTWCVALHRLLTIYSNS